MTESETSLLRRFLQGGDADAFAQITHQYAGLVYGTCRRITGNPDQAADATQETFFHLLKHAGRLTGSLASWLHQAALGRAIDLVRRDAARRRREQVYAATPRETDQWADISPLVDEALGEVDEALREVVVRHYLQGETMTDIAAAQGVSQPTISRRVDQALEALRDRLRVKGVFVAVAALAALLPNAMASAPTAVLRELGKMALTTPNTRVNALGTRASIGMKTKVAVTAAVGLAVVALIGIGTLAAHRRAETSRLRVARAGIVGKAPSPAPVITASQPRAASTMLPVSQAMPGAGAGMGAGGWANFQAGTSAAGAFGAGSVRFGGGGGGGGAPAAQGFGGIAVASSAVSVSQQVDLGRTYGNDGAWQKSFECFQRDIDLGNTTRWGELEWGWAISAALAAGKTQVGQEWCKQLIEQFGNRDNPDSAERCAKVCLVLPGISGTLLEKAAERADFAIGLTPDSRYRQLAKAMAEYRRGSWSNTLEWLRRPERSGVVDIGLQSCALAAMARHRLGDVAGARASLDELNRRVKVVVHAGELGDSQRKTWDGSARAVALRAEAERLILGRAESLPPDPSVVADRRRQWQGVVQLMRSAEQLARQEMWAEARDLYAQALAHPEFDWGPWELQASLHAQQMGIVFLMAGDDTRHRDLCRTLLSRPQERLPHATQERNAWACLIKVDHLPPDLKARALAVGRTACQGAEADASSWLRLVCALTASREGHHADALAALDQTRFGQDLVGEATALVLRAMSCRQAGKSEEAAAALQQAEELFGQRAAQNPSWRSVGLYRIVLQELRSMRG
jgi:RNA polymerase sigma factor (sigma-70 family)